MRIAVVAGEPSGDVLGGGLIAALAKRFPNAEFEGIGGVHMQAAGLRSLYPLDALSVMGLVEVLRHLPRLLGIRRRLRQRWQANPPDLFIGVDAPDFNLGLARTLRAQGVKTVQYVSPTVWAWRQGRIKHIRKAVDRILCIFPFEQSFFAEHAIDARFVGHPMADAIDLDTDHSGARRALHLPVSGRWVALLPGSRKSEIDRLMPLLRDIAVRVQAVYPQIGFVIPAATLGCQRRIDHHVASWPPSLAVRITQGQARTALAAADVGVVASGTATLEAMLVQCPTLMVYRLNPLTAMILRRITKVHYFAMPNLMAGEMLMPEFLQENATAEAIAPILLSWLGQADARAQLSERFQELHQELRCGASEQAADAVMDFLHAH